MNESRSSQSKEPETPGSLRFSAINGVLAAGGLVAVVAGYYLLAQGSVTWAPLLLVTGYVVFMPLAIIL